MAYEPKEGSLSLFKNDKKGNPNSPDWRGNGLFMGKKVKLAAWQKQSSKGEVFFSIKIEEDNYKPQVQNVPKKSLVGGMDDEMESQIPFAPLKGVMIAQY